jgi:hypothetical protein
MIAFMQEPPSRSQPWIDFAVGCIGGIVWENLKPDSDCIRLTVCLPT